MRTIRKILLLTLITILFLPIIPSKIYSIDSIPKRRIVTLIYDDSGSMWEGVNKKNRPIPIDNWKYANYALQSLVGLLNSEDLIYVTPMSKPTESKNISLEKTIRQDQIHSIQKWTGQKGTPIETISTAIKRINGLTKEHPDAEYWLIILTDGIFAELDQYQQGNSLANVTETQKATEQSLTNLTQKLRNNGIAFNSALVTIESYLNPSQKEIMSDFKNLWLTSTNGSVIESDNEENIVESINKVAALITNRDPDESKVFDLQAKYTERGVSLKSPFPLRRITVLNQSRDESSKFEIKEVAFNGQKRKGGIEGPYVIKSPIDPNNLTPPINGSITHIKQGDVGEVLPEGEYELHFSSEVTDEQKRNLRFLAEPAVDFNIKVNKLNQNGSLTDDESTFFIDSKMLLDVELIQSETKKPISLDDVNKEIFNIVAIVDDEKLNLAWDEKRKTFTGAFNLSEKEKIDAKVTVQIEGLYQKEKTTIIQSVPIRNLELKRASESPWSVKVDRLDDGAPIEIIPLVNGNEMTQEELEEVFSNIKVSFTDHQIEYDLKQKDNHIFIKPKKNKSIIMTSTGEIPVLVSMKGKYPKEKAELEFFIHVQDIPFYKKFWRLLLGILIFILLAIYIFGIITKARFARDRISLIYKRITIISGQKIHGLPSTENFNTNFFQRWMVPYKAETKSIQGISFKATKKPDKVILLKQSQIETMIVAGEKLGDNFGKRDIQIFSNDEIKIETHSSIEIYTFKTS